MATDKDTAKHTPGPWTCDMRATGNTNCTCGAVQPTKLGYISADTRHREIAVLYSQPNQEANGRLIAAAPDLLAACKAFIAAPENESVSYAGEEAVAITAMCAAIAKAEGAQ